MNLYPLDLKMHHIFIIIVVINSTPWLNLFLVKSKYSLISLQHNGVVDVSDLNCLLLNDEVQISFMLPLAQLNGNGEDNCTAHSLHVCFQCIENEFIHSYYELRLCTAHIHILQHLDSQEKCSQFIKSNNSDRYCFQLREEKTNWIYSIRNIF